MRHRVRTAAAMLIAAVLPLFVTAVLHAQKPARAPRRAAARAAAFQLFAAPTASLEANRAYCGITDAGELCTDVTGSPILGGGSWPRGTPDQYVFNTGIQVGAIIPANAAFDWAGDTVGAWAIDTRGPAVHMSPVTGIFNSLNPDDLASWPDGAVLTDAAVYDAALLGRKTASRQDTWVRYWDGDPTEVTGRNHPMGLLVEQRTLAWDQPGLEDIIFVVFRLTNITASAASVYDGLAAEGRSPADIAAIAALGAEFQRRSEAEFGHVLPDGGWPLASAYVNFSADMDVGDAANNYETGVLPFRMGVTWKSDWLEPGWQYPRTVFTEPFAVTPGLVAAKILRAPTIASTGQEAPFAMWTTWFKYPAPGVGVGAPPDIYAGYRAFSHTSDPAFGDTGSCAYPPSRIICGLGQAPADQRFGQSVGPFDLAPGQSALYAMAFLFAPALRANPGRPGFDLGPYIGNNGLVPGIPPRGDRLLLGLDTLRMIDAVMGWQSHTDLDGDGSIEEDEVTVVPGSLLDKARVAQAVFDNRFLMPAAPEAPDFYLLPGDNEVTLVWDRSATETAGDPYFAAASDVTTALYDPNYRSSDVEGYRVWRGTSPSNLELVAQYDYAGTQMQDWTGTFFNGDYTSNGRYLCAPELGITASCPAFPHAIELVDGGPGFAGAVQVAPGGRFAVRDASGTVVDVAVTRADTAVTGGGAGFPALTDTDVPLVYVDRDVRNGSRYYYAVTAFDVNSYRSGPSSQSSLPVAKSAVPRVAAANQQLATFTLGLYGDDTVQLDPSVSWTIDPATGRFTGPPPPTDGLVAGFVPLIQQLLPALRLTVTVDSLVPHSGADFACGAAENVFGTCYQAFLTLDRDGVSTPVSVVYRAPAWLGFGDLFATPVTLAAVPVTADSASAVRFGIPPGGVTFDATVTAFFAEYIRYSNMEGQAAGRSLFGSQNVSPGGSRWFSGADETEDHPGYGIRVGHLAGVDTVWSPINHTDIDPGTTGIQQYAQSNAMQCFGYALGGLGRQADVQVTWGANGQVASVRDITHRVAVPYKPNPEASYGFVRDANGDGRISFIDFSYLEVSAQNAAYAGLTCGFTDPGPGNRPTLAAQPTFGPVSTDGTTLTSPPTNGTGFGMYINGERFIFRLPGGAAPAAGTVWTLRTYAGYVRASANPSSFTPGNYILIPATRPAMIPGLRVVFRAEHATSYPDTAHGALARVHTVPDPLYVTHMPSDPTVQPELRFVNLPDRAIVRIYSTSGILVALLNHNDPTGGGELVWDLKSRNGMAVASGVYFWHVEAASGETRVGRFTLVTSGH